LELMVSTHPATVRASVVREGEWPGLSYSYQLGYGARRMTVLALGRAVDGFAELCKTMVATPDLTEAAELVAQTGQVLQASYEEMLRKIQLMGQNAFRDELKLDKAFWSICASEWGRGWGYRERVAKHNRTWFSEEQRLELEGELIAMIQREWDASLGRVSALLDTED